MTEIFFLVVVLSAVAPLPSGNETVIYYLLQNGSDTNNCGQSVSSACLTFEHLLNLYYAKPPSKGLKVVLDKSLILDHKIMVSFKVKNTSISTYEKIMNLIPSTTLCVVSGSLSSIQKLQVSMQIIGFCCGYTCGCDQH